MKSTNDTIKSVIAHSETNRKKRGKMFNKVISRSKKGTEKVWENISA